jgi:hypothetical protein
MVADEGFRSPTFAAMSPDGETSYFAALTDESRAAIFSMPAEGGEVSLLTDDERLELVGGLAITENGDTLFVGEGLDSGEFDLPDQSTVYTLSASGGPLTPLQADGVRSVSGMVLLRETLYITGTDEDGVQALFTLDQDGGTAHVVLAGPPLIEPDGLDVDDEGTSWVIQGDRTRGLGSSLIAVASDGSVTEVVSGLGLTTSCFRFKGGNYAVVPRTNDDGVELLVKNLVTGDTSTIQTDMSLAAGVAGSREVGRIVITDNQKNAIYLVQ